MKRIWWLLVALDNALAWLLERLGLLDWFLEVQTRYDDWLLRVQEKVE